MQSSSYPQEMERLRIESELVQALYDYHSPNDSEKLSFNAGDTILVVKKAESGWWDGICNNRRGWFPSNFVTAPEIVSITPKKSFGWVGRKTRDHQHLYHNMLTGETLSVDGNLEVSEEHKTNNSNVDNVGDNKTDELPPNWRIKTTENGKSYYYNILTNETTWSLEDTDPETGYLKSKQPTLPPSISHELSPIREDGLSPTLNSAWDKMYLMICTEISTLKDLATRKEKQKFLQQTSNIVSSIHIMLNSSKTLDKESLCLKNNKMLAIHHRHILRALSKLVLSAKHATGVWPAPNSMDAMCIDANEVLLAVRHFSMTAKNSGIYIDSYVDELKPTPITEKEPPRNTNTPQESDAIYPRTSYTIQTILEGIDLAPKLISEAISLLHNIVHKRNENLAFGADIIAKTREIVTEVGQFLSLIEDIDLINIDQATLTDFEKFKESLYNAIRSLVSATTSTVEPLPNVDVFEQVIAFSSLVESAVNDLVISAKYVLEQRQEIDTKNLQKNAENIQASLDDSYVSLEPRRALSLNELPDENEDTTNFSEITKETILESHSLGKYQRMPISIPKLDIPSASSNGDSKNLSRSFDSKKSKYKPQKVSMTPRRITVSGGASKFPQLFGENGSQNLDNNSSSEWYLRFDHSPNDLLLSMEGQVKGATLPALVERMTSHDVYDSTLIHAFLVTYRTFTTAETFFELLKSRFIMNMPEGLTQDEEAIWIEKKQKPVRLRVFNIIKTWVDSYFMEDDYCLIDDLLEFAENVIGQVMSQPSEQLIRLIEKRKTDILSPNCRKPTSPAVKAPPTPILPRSLKRLKTYDIDPVELARQLTLMESRLYNSILPSECLGKAWSDKENNLAPNIKAMINLTNHITGWVAESILSEKDIKKRCSVMKYFILVGEKCRSMGNYNALMAILAAINSSPIHRLKRTKELLSTKTRSILAELKKLMAPNQNFSNYRNELRTIGQQCVPFLGMYLTDLTFIEDGNGDHVKSMPHLINFDKRLKTAEKIREIQQYQQLYNFIEVTEIQMFIKMSVDSSTKDAEELYQKSLHIEPREREDEKIARLLQEIGFL